MIDCGLARLAIWRDIQVETVLLNELFLEKGPEEVLMNNGTLFRPEASGKKCWKNGIYDAISEPRIELWKDTTTQLSP